MTVPSTVTLRSPYRLEIATPKLWFKTAVIRFTSAAVKTGSGGTSTATILLSNCNFGAVDAAIFAAFVRNS